MLIESERRIAHRDRVIQGLIAGLAIAAVLATMLLSAPEVTTSPAEADPLADEVVRIDLIDQVRRLVTAPVAPQAPDAPLLVTRTTTGAVDAAGVGGTSTSSERTATPGSHVDPREPEGGTTTTESGVGGTGSSTSPDGGPTGGGSTGGGSGTPSTGGRKTVVAGVDGTVSISDHAVTSTVDASVDTPVVSAGTSTAATVDDGGSVGATSSTSVTTPVTTATAQVGATVGGGSTRANVAVDTGLGIGVSVEVGAEGLKLGL